MIGYVVAFGLGALLGMTGVGPIALMVAGLAGAALFWRSSKAKDREAEMTDELAGYDPYESYADARRRFGLSNLEQQEGE